MGFIKKMFDHFKQTATATEINKIKREDDTLQIGDIVLLYWIDTNNGDFSHHILNRNIKSTLNFIEIN